MCANKKKKVLIIDEERRRNQVSQLLHFRHSSICVVANTTTLPHTCYWIYRHHSQIHLIILTRCTHTQTHTLSRSHIQFGCVWNSFHLNIYSLVPMVMWARMSECVYIELYALRACHICGGHNYIIFNEFRDRDVLGKLFTTYTQIYIYTQR